MVKARMDETHRPSPPPPDAVLRATRRMLRPLVRLLIQAGATFPVLTELLRQLYVDVAVTDVLRDRRERTDSRISLITGLQRRDVRRLRIHRPEPDEVPAAVTIGTRAIAHWLSLPAFTGPDGSPRPLPRAGEASFDSLIASVTTDVRARTVLNDWLAQGIVTMDNQDRVHLNAVSFVPRGGRTEQMFYFGRNLRDHIEAAVTNVSLPGAPPFLDRTIHYDRLDDATARKLESAAREAAERVIVEMTRTANAMVDGVPEVDGETGLPYRGRVNFGLYVYRDEGRDDDWETPEQ